MDEATMGIGLGILLSSLVPGNSPDFRAEELHRRLMAAEGAVLGLPPSLARGRTAKGRHGKRKKKKKKVSWLRTYIPGQTLQRRPPEPEQPPKMTGPLSSGKPTSDPVLKKTKKSSKPPNSTKRPHKPPDLERRPQKPPDHERKPSKPTEHTKKTQMPPDVVRKRAKASESTRRLQKPPELERKPQKSKPKMPMPDLQPKHAARKPKGESRLPSLPHRKSRRERPAESRIKLPKLKNYFHDLVLQGDFERTYHDTELNHLRDLLLDESLKSAPDRQEEEAAPYSYQTSPSFLPDLELKRSTVAEEEGKESYKMQLANLIDFFANRSPRTMVVTESPNPPQRTAKQRDREWRSIKLPKLRHIMPEPPPFLAREKPKAITPPPPEALTLKEREREFYSMKLARLEETITHLPEIKPAKSEKKRYKLLINGLDRLSSPYMTRGPAIDVLTELSESLDQHAAPVDIGTDGTANRLAPWRHRPSSPKPPTPPPAASKKRKRKRTSKSVVSNGSEISVRRRRRRSNTEVREEPAVVKKKVKTSDAVDVTRKVKAPIDDDAPDDSLARAYREVIAQEKKLKAARLGAEPIGTVAPPKRVVAPAARRKPTLPSVSLTGPSSARGKIPAPSKTTRRSESLRLPTMPKDAAKTAGLGDERRPQKGVDGSTEKRRKPLKDPDAVKMPPATVENSRAKKKKKQMMKKIPEPIRENRESEESPLEDSTCWESKSTGPESSQFFLRTLMEFSQPEK